MLDCVFLFFLPIVFLSIVPALIPIPFLPFDLREHMTPTIPTHSLSPSLALSRVFVCASIVIAISTCDNLFKPNKEQTKRRHLSSWSIALLRARAGLF